MPILEFRILSFNSVSYPNIPFKFRSHLKFLLPQMLFRDNPDGICLVFRPFFIASVFQRALLTFLYIEIIVIVGIILLFRICLLETLLYSQLASRACYEGMLRSVHPYYK